MPFVSLLEIPFLLLSVFDVLVGKLPVFPRAPSLACRNKYIIATAILKKKLLQLVMVGY